MRVEIRIGNSHRIDEVRNAPRKVNVGQIAPEISSATVATFSSKSERIAGTDYIGMFEFVFMAPVDQTVGPLDLIVRS